MFLNSSDDLAKYLKVKIKKGIIFDDISIDSRSIKRKSLFIAIKGNNFNGNDFVEDAFKNKAVLAIVDDKRFIKSNDKRIIYVKNTISAMKKISKAIINSYDGKVIAITGSNGKTSTTKILSKVIKSNSHTIKNFNNEIGLPLSLFKSNPKSKNLVFEIGASKAGDIDYLSSILKPHIGVITSIGHSHLEKLKNLDGVLRVKSELLKNIKKNGILIVPSGNNKYLYFWKKYRKDLKILTQNIRENADAIADSIKLNESESKYKIFNVNKTKSIEIKTNLIGEHNIRNVLSAYLVVDSLNESKTYFCNNLIFNNKNLSRQKKYKWINSSTLIDDSYNANPDSVKKGVDYLSKIAKRRVLILGDMLELGRYRRKYHREIGIYSKENGVNIMIGFGKLVKYSIDSFGRGGHYFTSSDELVKFLKKIIKKNDLILLKGSRGMKMERFINV